MGRNYTDFLTPGVSKLTPYQPGKPIEELEREYGLSEIIKLASNENPLGPSNMAQEAIKEVIDHLWLYPDGNGFKLKSALASLHQVDANRITLGNGSSEPLEFVVRALVQPGDEVLFSEHAFAVYPLVTLAAGGQPVTAPARDWGYDLNALKDKITPKTRVIFIANPNNPTGTIVGSDELYRFIDSISREIVVVVDEAYYEYARDLKGDEYPDTSRWLEEFEHLMVTRTFSKAYGLAGIRIGYSLSHPKLADLMNRVRPPFNTNSLAQVAALAALGDLEHLQHSINLNRLGMQQLGVGFKTLNLDYIPSAGNFIAVRVGDASTIYEGLLRSGVIVRPIANYQMPEYLRITIGTEKENRRLLDALGQLIKD